MDIKSQSQLARHEAKDFFVPGAAEVILYFLSGTIFLVVYSFANVVSRLGNNYLGSPENLKTNFSTLSTGFSSYFSTALGGRLGQIMLWSFIGAFSYIGLWMAKNVLNSFENDIISAHYLHPSSYSRVGYWGSAFSAKIFLFAQLLITAAYLFVALTSVWPALAALAASAAYNFHPATSPFYMLFTLAAGALVVYIGVVFLKLISHLWKKL
jgi:hypothetical protein